MSISPSVVSDITTTNSANPFFASAVPDLILLIDDDDFIADIVEQILSRSGKRVLRARNGMEGTDSSSLTRRRFRWSWSIGFFLTSTVF
jgi:hypothetical protein